MVVIEFQMCSRVPNFIKVGWFLSRVSILTRDIDITNMSVSPSVRYVPVPYENGLTYRHSFFTIRFPNHSSFTSIKHFHKIPTGSSPAGVAKYRWGIKISRFSTNKSLYLANDTRYRYSYYGRRIGTRMRSIKWCHFPLPWTNSNHVFRDTPLFDAKYLTNG